MTPLAAPLAAGTILGIAEVTVSGNPGADLDHLTPLLREGLRQSARFDVAGGIEEVAAPCTLSAHLDVGSARLSATLLRSGEAPRALAQVDAGQDLHAAVDTLARAALTALGEDVGALPWIAAGRAFSGDPRAIRLTERALGVAAGGQTATGLQLLRQARPLDPGSPLLLCALATLLLDQGNPAEAVKVAREALNLTNRLTPTTQHRLVRVLLLASAADTDLETLGRAALRERPHDPHGRYTLALGLDFQRRFAESLPVLRALRKRWPYNAAVAWHLAFAECAAGEAESALALLDAVARQLPAEAALRPRAVALFTLRRFTELQALCDDTALALERGPERGADTRAHEVRRMQAAASLLRGDGQAAARHLLEDLEWLRRRPGLLGPLSLDLVEAGEVLVRLRRAREVREALTGLAAIHPQPPEYAHALAYLGALVDLELGQERPTAVEATLGAEGLTDWTGRLRAAYHQRRGELAEETGALVQASQAGTSYLVRAALARALQLTGREAEARDLRAILRRELQAIDLRRPQQHPVASPAAALAFLATE